MCLYVSLNSFCTEYDGQVKGYQTLNGTRGTLCFMDQLCFSHVLLTDFIVVAEQQDEHPSLQLRPLLPLSELLRP